MHRPRYLPTLVILAAVGLILAIASCRTTKHRESTSQQENTIREAPDSSNERLAGLVARFGADTSQSIDHRYSIELRSDSTPVLLRSLDLLDIGRDGKGPYVLVARTGRSNGIEALLRLRITAPEAQMMI